MRFRILLVFLLIFAMIGCARKYYEKQKSFDLLTSDAVDATVRVL